VIFVDVLPVLFVGRYTKSIPVEKESLEEVALKARSSTKARN
jgi:hypothetical protein